MTGRRTPAVMKKTVRGKEGATTRRVMPVDILLATLLVTVLSVGPAGAAVATSSKAFGWGAITTANSATAPKPEGARRAA